MEATSAAAVVPAPPMSVSSPRPRSDREGEQQQQQQQQQHRAAAADGNSGGGGGKPRRLSMESGPVTCDLCNKVYKNRSTLYSHKNRDHGVKASQQR